MSLNKILVNNTTTVNTGVVYDITKATGQSYDNLSAALGTSGNNVPPEVREGGMSIRFVSNSDNKYVQYMYKGTSISAADFTNADNWEKMNLEEEVSQLENKVYEKLETTPIVVPSTYSAGYINSSGTVAESQFAVHSDFVAIEPGFHYFYESITTTSWYIGYYSAANESAFISVQSLPQSPSAHIRVNLDIPAGVTHFRITKSSSGSSLYKATLLPNPVISYINDLQSQINEIDIDTVEIERILSILYNLLSELETNSLTPSYTNGYIGADGTTNASQYARYSDFVEIQLGGAYSFSSITSENWYIGYYSSANESSFISAQQLPSSSGQETTINLNIPAGAKYFRITRSVYSANTIIENVNAPLPNPVISYINDLQSQINEIDSEISEEIEEIEEILSEDVVNNLNPNYSAGYIDSDGTVTASSYAYHSDYIEIKSNGTYRFKTISTTTWNIGYYSTANESAFISAQALLQSASEEVWQTTVIPTGAKYMRISRYWDSENPTTLIIESYTRLLPDRLLTYINYLQAQIDSLKSGDGQTKQFAGIDKLGFVKNPSLFESDLMYVPMYGQSYTVANDGEYKLTTEFDSNLFMHAYGKPIGKGDTTLRQLATGLNEEYIISDFAEVFSRLIKEYLYKTQDILVGSYGMGSRSVIELSKNNGYGSGYDAYETIFEPGVANAVAAAANANKSISCPFILYLQGESDTVEGNRETAAAPDSWCKGDKDMYKQSLLQLKNDMQQTIMTATGQTVKPLFFVYACGNQNFSSSQSGIQQAVLELQQENDDFFVVGPYYYMTSMGAHPSPDGRRWLAELFAKQIFETIVHGEETTMKVESYSVFGTRLALSVKTPQEPLQIDTHTCQQRTNYGFRLYHYSNGALGAEIAISSVIVNSSSIILVTNEDLEDIPVGGLFVTYGNTSAEGGGNICDSGKWRSYYNYASNNDGTGHIVYIPLDENGQSYVGKKYPMKTWMPQFGFSI